MCFRNSVEQEPLGIKVSYITTWDDHTLNHTLYLHYTARLIFKNIYEL